MTGCDFIFGVLTFDGPFTEGVLLKVKLKTTRKRSLRREF